MELKKVKILKLGVTLQGVDCEIGAVIELNKHSAQSLVDAKLGAITDEALNAPMNESKDPNGKLPTGDTGGVPKVVADESAADIDKLAKAIDAKYKAEPLKEAAKKLDVQFKFDATKAEVITAVIAAGKGDAILAL